MAEQTPPAQPISGSAEQLNASTLTKFGGTGAAGNQYNVGTYVYPLDTSARPDLLHYVGFFINVRGKSKYKQSYQTTEITGTDENRADRTKLGQRFNVLAGAAGAYAGAKLGKSVAGTVLANAGKTSTTAKVIGVGAGAIAGGIAGAAVATLFEADKTFRINDAIMLAINGVPSFRYRADYDTVDLGSTGGLLAGGSSAVDAGTMSMTGEYARALMLQAAELPGSIASAVGASFNPSNLASVGTGTTPNPFREQMFKSVDNRTFNFEYRFLPRSAQEARNVENIIKRFKFHMHPEVTAGGLFYVYPSEFNIVYYYNGQENRHIAKISTCVLTDLSVDYGGSNGFHTFADGTPTEITLRLGFKELETLTKERINVGY